VFSERHKRDIVVWTTLEVERREKKHFPESDFQGVMDFDSLVGTAAYLAKQLELRWFYHWELPGWRDRSSTSAVVNCTSSEAAGNCQALQQMTPWAGRLVRKRHHSMPFLRRNTHNAHGDGRTRTFRRSTNARGDSAIIPKKSSASVSKRLRLLQPSFLLLNRGHPLHHYRPRFNRTSNPQRFVRRF